MSLSNIATRFIRLIKFEFDGDDFTELHFTGAQHLHKAVLPQIKFRW